MSKSQQKWLNNELIGVNSVLYNSSSETIILINFYKMDNGEMLAFPLCDTTINSLEKYNKDIWTEIQEYKSIPYKNDEIIKFGEGAMGNEGFICVTDKNNTLKWSIFFEDSNPIIDCKICEEKLSLTSSNGQKITVNLKNLLEIKITGM